MKMRYNKLMLLWDVCPLENGYIELYYDQANGLVGWIGRRYGNDRKWLGTIEGVQLKELLQASKQAYGDAMRAMMYARERSKENC